MNDRSDDPSHHARTLLPRSYISLPKSIEYKWYIAMFALDVIKTEVVSSCAGHDQPIDQVGPNLTSPLHKVRSEVVYC